MQARPLLLTLTFLFAFTFAIFLLLVFFENIRTRCARYIHRNASSDKAVSKDSSGNMHSANSHSDPSHGAEDEFGVELERVWARQGDAGEGRAHEEKHWRYC